MSEATDKILKFMEKSNKKLKGKYGVDTLYLASQVNDFKPYQTGFPTFDWINSGIGGFPRGGMTLVHGIESCGKTTFILEAIKYQQAFDPNSTALYIDVENALTDQFLKRKGIDPTRVCVTPLNACEDALTLARDAIKDGMWDIVVVDSLAKLDSEKILEKDIGESAQRNRRAVLITEFLRSISLILRHSKTAFVCINQEIQNQDPSPWAPKMILPCGMQQKYTANLRIEIKRGKAIKDGAVKIGYKIGLSTKKCKISDKENALTDLTYLSERGFIREFSLLDYLVLIGYVKKLPANKYEFNRKDLYPEVFKPGQISKIAVDIKDTYDLDLYSIPPTSDITFEKETNDDDSPTDEECSLNIKSPT